MGDSVYREVYKMLRITTNYLKDELRKKIEDSGITWQQFHAMYHIAEDGIQFNELAKELSCNASNMTGLIDRMTENGWAYRVHSEHDRRVWLVKLTENGLKLKNELLPQHQKNIIQYMSVLSEEEVIALKGILTKLMNNNNEGDGCERV